MNHRSQTSFDTSPQKDELIYIYGLYAASDDTETIMYVGKTNNLLVRWIDHVRSYGFCRKSKWVKSLLSQNDYPVLKVIDTCSSHDCLQREFQWISHFHSINPDIKNTIGIQREPKAKKAFTKSARRAKPHQPISDPIKLRFCLDKLVSALGCRTQHEYSDKEIAAKSRISYAAIYSLLHKDVRVIDLTTLAALIDFFASEGMPITVADLFSVEQVEQP